MLAAGDPPSPRRCCAPPAWPDPPSRRSDVRAQETARRTAPIATVSASSPASGSRSTSRRSPRRPRQAPLVSRYDPTAAAGEAGRPRGGERSACRQLADALDVFQQPALRGLRPLSLAAPVLAAARRAGRGRAARRPRRRPAPPPSACVRCRGCNMRDVRHDVQLRQERGMHRHGGVEAAVDEVLGAGRAHRPLLLRAERRERRGGARRTTGRSAAMRARPRRWPATCRWASSQRVNASTRSISRRLGSSPAGSNAATGVAPPNTAQDRVRVDHSPRHPSGGHHLGRGGARVMAQAVHERDAHAVDDVVGRPSGDQLATQRMAIEQVVEPLADRRRERGDEPGTGGWLARGGPTRAARRPATASSRP